MTDKHEDEHRDETEGREEPRVHDKRRIDPVTGEPREPASAGSGAAPASAADASAQAGETAAAPEGASSDDLSEADRALLEGEAAAIEAERAALQAKSEQQQDELARLKADYVNYRNRTERERAGDRDATIASVITTLLPALDDLDLADKHGDLAEGPLAIVAQKLRASFEALGVVRLGEVGEAFDIDKHEAVAQLPNPEVTEMVVADVVQAGYRVGERMLRAAKVAVFVPAE
jgi:molecular chaperone GrpE